MTKILYNHFEECFFSKRGNKMKKRIGKLNNNNIRKKVQRKIVKIDFKVNDF